MHLTKYHVCQPNVSNCLWMLYYCTEIVVIIVFCTFFNFKLKYVTKFQICSYPILLHLLTTAETASFEQLGNQVFDSFMNKLTESKILFNIIIILYYIIIYIILYYIYYYTNIMDITSFFKKFCMFAFIKKMILSNIFFENCSNKKRNL